MPGHKHRKCRAERCRELLFADTDDKEYCLVVRAVGDKRFEILCKDGATRLGCARGRMRRSEWIRMGDLVLCTKRDFQESKLDIVHKYSEEETRTLMSMDQIPAAIARSYGKGVVESSCEAVLDLDADVAFDDI